MAEVLGAVAGSMTVATTALRVYGAANNLNYLLTNIYDIPEDILALKKELNDFVVVLAQLEDVFSHTNHQDPSEEEFDSSDQILEILICSNSIVEELNKMTQGSSDSIGGGSNSIAEELIKWHLVSIRRQKLQRFPFCTNKEQTRNLHTHLSQCCSSVLILLADHSSTALMHVRTSLFLESEQTGVENRKVQLFMDAIVSHSMEFFPRQASIKLINFHRRF